ncbi:four helix bundle protein [Oscillatoria sp. CS-180]|uniref:four helix bundle protein n=1 Tax=Oscillatoria sp. CS-180 TaxID=3021720 RepID=UPI00232C3A04|nr:four helix bundle protein [Oscillatoria sp. CS-180]MDB9527036.1 four helix bundle protein [Oscillatoria sp. CS-180]
MRKGFRELEVYQLAEELSDEIWKIVVNWDFFAKDTVGKQLVRSADSVGANLAEGAGRGSYRDNRRFITIARGSLIETQHWLRRAQARNLLTPDQTQRLKPLINKLAPKLNAYRNAITKMANNQQPTTNNQ